jgi:hypothetical protein
MIPRNIQITLALVLIAVIGSAIYGVQLKRRDERNRQHGAALLPATAEAKVTKFQALVAFDEDEVLSVRELSAPLPEEPSARTREVLRALLQEYMRNPSPHAIPAGSDVKAVYLTKDGLCVIDLNPTLADQHRSGMLLEQFTVLSLLETAAMNLPSAKQIQLIVDGKERASLAGHADLSMAYDVSAIHAAAREYAKR